MKKGENKESIFEETIQTFIEKIRPPQEIRDEFDIGYTFEKRVLEIFEIRANWRNESEKIHIPVVKVRFMKSKQIWKMYWMRANGKWESYKPLAEEIDLYKVLEEIDNDPWGAFWT